jgi:CheY-like chemotaxis protein
MCPGDSSPALILVVDDDPFVLRLIAEVLSAEGYEVDTARNGREALEKTAARLYDLVLSDLRMPEVDGVALYRELERRQPRLLRRFVAVSGTTEPPEYASFLEETNVPLLSKPFRVEELQQIVRRILG